jgi:hypothetical protein
MSRNKRNRRWARGVGTVGAAFAAALIGLAPTARADTELDPLEDLFGDTGFNSWTPSTDASLLSGDPTLAGSLDTSVDNFLTNVAVGQDDPLSSLLYEFDPTSFSFDGFTGIDPEAGGLPNDGLADLAVGLDYTLFAGGLESLGTGVTDLVQIPYDIALGLLYLPLLPFILAGA